MSIDQPRLEKDASTDPDAMELEARRLSYTGRAEAFLKENESTTARRIKVPNVGGFLQDANFVSRLERVEDIDPGLVGSVQRVFDAKYTFDDQRGRHAMGHIADVPDMVNLPIDPVDAKKLRGIQRGAARRNTQGAREREEELGATRAIAMHEAKDQADKDAELFCRGLTALDRANMWFGDDTYLTITNPWDDWTNHTDLVMTMYVDRDGRRVPLHLAVGVTIAKSDAVLGNKISSIRNELKTGAMTTVKYFEDPEEKGQRGSLEGIPRVEVAIDPRSEEEGDPFYQFKQMVADYFSGRDQKTTERSTLPTALLDIMIAELESWKRYILKTQAPNADAMIMKINELVPELRRRYDERKAEYGVPQLDRIQAVLKGIAA